MDLQVVWTLVILVGMMTALAVGIGSADFVMLAALAALLMGGVISPKEALAGFSNEGMITVALLFVLSEAIRNTGALNGVVTSYLGNQKSKSTSRMMLKMMAPIAALSAFLNNTAIVAIFTPTVKKWTSQLNLPASKFFIPLSYVTVLGGCVTLIGTSTNLIVHGLLLQKGMKGFSFFELAWVGIPCTLVGIIYLMTIGKNLLPNHKGATDLITENSREYVVEMKVKKDSPLIGRSIEQAGLRNLRGLFLVDIERGGKSLGTVARSEILAPEDRLLFAGVTSAVLDLQEIPGLVPAEHETFEGDLKSLRMHLVEAFVSSNSPILGKTIKECGFRSRYDAGVVAVHRNGERIQQKIGDIELRAGDTLLVFAQEDFVQNWRDSQDFYLISYLGDKPPVVSWQGYALIVMTVVMIAFAVIGETADLKLFGNHISIFQMALLGVIGAFLLGTLRAREAKQALRTDVLIAIACSFGISKALENTGIAQYSADQMVSVLSHWGPYAVLAGIYLLANLFTELMSNNAAAVLVFPIAVAIAEQMGVSPMPFVIAVTVAASYGFATPIGYQTHLMVQSAGGYKFSDYLKVGPLLNLICFILATLIIPIVWKF